MPVSFWKRKKEPEEKTVEEWAYTKLDGTYIKDHILPINRNLYDTSNLVITDFMATKRDHHPDLIGSTDIVRYGVMELLLEEVKKRGIPGECAELGVYKGMTARYINRMMPEKKLYLFDTFEGFDERDLDGQGMASDRDGLSMFSDTSVEAVMAIMQYPESCEVRKGYFPETSVGLEDERFCFVSIDCDLYMPTLEGLKYFYPRLSKGGYMMIHDYNNAEFEEGIRRAIDEFREIEDVSLVPIPDLYGSVVISK